MLAIVSAKEKPEEFLDKLRNNQIKFEYKYSGKLDVPVIAVDIGIGKISIAQLHKENEEKILKKLISIKGNTKK